MLTQADIAVKNGKISHINQTLNLAAERTLDLKGLTVLPGVIDSQVHFREPGLTHKEDLESGTRAAVLGGVTSVFEMPNTNPSTTTKESFQEKLNLAANRAHCDHAFFIGAAHDNTENLAELEKAPHCVGVKIFLGASFGSLLVDSDEVFEQVMKNGKRRLTIHSEDEARLRERKHIAVDGAHPRVHHIWRDEESAMISTKKSIALARKYNRPVHILHVSSSEEMEFLAKQKDIASVEILPQFLTLSAPECYERLGTLAQQNPPIRDKRHMEKLWQAVHNGTVDIIGSDHAPHTLEEKNKPYPQSPSGFPGVQTLIPIMLDHVHNKRMALDHFVRLVTENPRRLFNVKNKGRIEIGYDADFTVVDLKKEVTITNKWIASKCGYTPFDGMKVTGWPTHTIIRGQIVMQDDTVIKPSTGKAISFG
ncbi:MAG: dihydroorotase [Pseudobdellovibrio sp.]|nr:dihydroorotase [Pseudobdellovibrio sp.]